MSGAFFTADDGVRLWYEISGSGFPVVLCHGGPGMWDNLGPLGDLIAGSARVIRWEQRGSGRSDRAGPYTVSRSVADLEQLREHLGLERWIVGGHSWGASLALRYALAHPDRASGLLYLSGVGTGQAWKAAYRAERDRRLSFRDRRRRQALKDKASRSPDEEREYRRLSWAPDYAVRRRAMEWAGREADAPFETNDEANRLLNLEAEGWDEAALLAECRRFGKPSLIVHGAGDPRPVWGVESLHAALSDSELRVVPHAGHLPWVEAPGEVAMLLLEFVRKVEDSVRTTGPKPDNVKWESWIERQIRESMERGEFDNLPGAGKPIPGLAGADDDLWWVRDKLRREQVSHLPPALELRKEYEEALHRIDTAHTEAQVRRLVAEINQRIVYANTHTIVGPPTNLVPLDLERVVKEWRSRRG